MMSGKVGPEIGFAVLTAITNGDFVFDMPIIHSGNAYTATTLTMLIKAPKNPQSHMRRNGLIVMFANPFWKFSHAAMAHDSPSSRNVSISIPISSEIHFNTAALLSRKSFLPIAL